MTTPSWLTTNKSEYLVSEYDVVAHLPPGYYRCVMTRNGRAFYPIPVRDDLIYDVDPDARRLLLEIDRFLKAGERYRRLGVSYKRGILLSGPAGGGKSTIVRQAINKVIALKGYGILFDADAAEDLPIHTYIGDLRKREGNVPILIVIEDIDGLLGEYESTILETLDGTVGMEGVLFVATTNHFEKLPDRIKDRPGRFDTILTVDMPSPEVRKTFISRLLGLSEEHKTVLDYWNAPEIAGKSLAHVKEFVLMKEIYQGL